jgi:hypothetical protein
MHPHAAVEAAYRYGHAPKVGMTVDSVVDEAAQPDTNVSAPKLEHHCVPLKKMVDENRMTADQAIEAAYKLGLEESGASSTAQAENEVESPVEPEKEAGNSGDEATPKRSILRRRAPKKS